MRLAILDDGHAFGAKVMFAMIRLFSGQRVVDAVKLVMYRPDFYGGPMKQVTHEAMRGPSTWSVGDRELMAAFVSNLKSSKVLSRKGNRLEVEQEAQAKRGPLTFAFSTIRAVELLAEREIRSTLVRGDFKSYAFTTRISPTSEGLTEIVHHGEYVPNRWVPPGIGPSLIRSETGKQYDELIAEIRRRKNAALPPAVPASATP